MAWNMSTAKRRALVKLQLRDKNGKFIEMGGGVKWFSSRIGKVVGGTVVGTKGENALVRLDESNGSKLVSVPAHNIEPIQAKESLPGKGVDRSPSNADTPEFEKPEQVSDSKADDQEADEATESDHERSVEETDSSAMASMEAGTVLRDAHSDNAHFIKLEGDNWEHHLSSGAPSGLVSTSASIKNHDGFSNHTFAKPGTDPLETLRDGDNAPQVAPDVANGNGSAPEEADGAQAPAEDSAADFSITETSDGNSYITRADGQELYSPARELQVGDEVIAPAGADPTKPFSIGRNWATKGAERLNSDGPKIGKVVAVNGQRYAVVQMAGGHTIADRHNPEEVTDTVTIGLSNRVIKATPGLKEALGEKLGDQTYAERPDANAPEANAPGNAPEEAAPATLAEPAATPEAPAAPEATSNAPEAPSEAPAAPQATDVAPDAAEAPAAPEAPKDFGVRYELKNGLDTPVADKPELMNEEETAEFNRLKGAILDAQHNNRSVREGTARTAMKVLENKVRERNASEGAPADAPEDKGMEVTRPNSTGGTPEPASEPDKGMEIERPNSTGGTPEKSSEPDKGMEVERPNSDGGAPEASSEPDKGMEVNRPSSAEPAPEKKDEATAAPSEVSDVADSLSQIEQDIEDIDSSGLQGEDLAAAIEEAKHDITGPNGEAYTVVPVKDSEGQWNYALADADGAEVGNWPSSEYDSSAEIAQEIHDAINGNGSQGDSGSSDAPAEAAPEAPKAESYNENGLTEEEQAQVTAFGRMIARSENAGQFERADALAGQLADLVAKGEARKNAPAAPEAAPEAAPAAPEAPSSAPITGPSNAEMITNAEKMYGTGSPQHKRAQERFGEAAEAESKAATPAEKPAKASETAPEADKAPESAPEAEKAQEAAPAPAAPELDPLTDGVQDEMKIPGVRKQAKRDDKTTQHVKMLDKLEAGDRVSSTNAHGETSLYEKHADGTWDQIDPEDDSVLSEALPASEVADMHKRGDLKPVSEEEVAPEAPATPATAPSAPETPETPADVPTPNLVEPDAPAVDRDTVTDTTPEPLIGKGMFPERFSIQPDGRGNGLNKFVTGHSGEMWDNEISQMHGLNRKFQMAQATGNEDDVRKAEREFAKFARKVDSRLKRDPANTRRNQKIDALELDNVNNVVNSSNPEDNWTKGPDGNWTHSTTDETKNSAEMVDHITATEGYVPLKDSDMVDTAFEPERPNSTGGTPETPAADNGMEVGRPNSQPTPEPTRTEDNGMEVTRPEASPAPAPSNEPDQGMEVARPNSQPTPEPSRTEDNGMEVNRPSSAEPAAEDVPEHNEDGLIPSEAGYFDALNKHLADIYNPNGTATGDVEAIEGEINDMLTHGEERLAGRNVGTFRRANPRSFEERPAPVKEPEAPEAPEAPAAEAPAAPRRTRTDFSGVSVVDKNGQAVVQGDTIGHPTHGPVQIVNVIPASGRVEFINPQTGRKGSVKAANVAKIDATAAPEAEATPVDLPTSPGSIFIDPATGKKAFIGKDGVKIVSGDRVVDRNGKVGVAQTVYAGRDGLASVPVKFDGEDSPRRVKGSLLSPENGAAQAPAAPENAPEVAQPAAPSVDSTPEVAPAPEVQAPEAPAAPALPEGTIALPASRGRAQAHLDFADIGATLTDANGDKYTKIGRETWKHETTGFVHDTDSLARRVESGGWHVAEPTAETPAAPSVPEAPAVDRFAPNSRTVESYSGRKALANEAPVGTVFKDLASGKTYRKVEDNAWTNLRGETLNNNSLAVRIHPDNGDWRINPAEDDAPSTPMRADAPLPTDATDRKFALASAPIGTKIAGPNGAVYTKVADELWTEPTGAFKWNNGEMSMMSHPQTGQWRFNPSQADMITTSEAMSPDRFERIAEVVNVPVGGQLHHEAGSAIFTRTGHNTWSGVGSDAVFDDAMVESMVNPAFGRWSTKVPNSNGESAADAPSAAPFQGTLPSDRAERIAKIDGLPEGSVITVRGYVFEKTGPDAWELGDGETPHTAEDVAAASTPNDPGVVTQPNRDAFTPPSEPYEGGPLSSNAEERAWQISQIPEGGFIVGGNGDRTFVRRGDDLWSPADAPQEYYGDYDVDMLARLGRSTPPVASMPVPVPTGIHPALPNGSFLPNSEGSETGFKRVGDNKWEMIRNGEPTGRFSDDANVQMLMDMNETSVVPPALDPEKFGTDLGVQLIDGKSIGDWMAGNGANFGRLSVAQKKAITDHYNKFIDNLNTKLPAGYTAKLGDKYGNNTEISFNSAALNSYVSFYKGRTRVGTAHRIFRTHVDSRTGNKVSSVEHNLFQVDQAHQGGGLSSAFLNASSQMYRQMGLDRITIHANIDVGGYAWARGGFDFQSPQRMSGAISNWDSSIFKYDSNTYRLTTEPRPAPHGISEADWQAGVKEYIELKKKATATAFMNGTHPAPIQFANIGRPSGPTKKEDTWFGKAMMLDSDWFGMLPLNSGE